MSCDAWVGGVGMGGSRDAGVCVGRGKGKAMCVCVIHLRTDHVLGSCFPATYRPGANSNISMTDPWSRLGSLDTHSLLVGQGRE